MGRKEIKLRDFPTPEKAEHIRLVKGIYKNNPHVRVLCPQLVVSGLCKKKGGKGKGIPHARPKLLLQHHYVPNLQLWQCKCKDFLLRVEL